MMPKFIVVLIVSLLTVVAPARDNTTVVTDEFVTSATWQPTAMDFTSDGTALVTSKLARVEKLNLDTGAISPYLFLSNGDIAGERGLIDILVDPQTDEVFLYRSISSSQLVIERFNYTGDAGVDAASLTTIWSNPGPLHNQFGANHLGGGLAFGSDGATIFLSIGDGERAGNSQDLSNVFGKVLRLNRDGSVPTDNPFFDGPGSNIDEIWALGLRNPFRIWSGADGVLWLGDVGGNDHSIAYEEIHKVEPAANYGWPMCQGPNAGAKNGPDCPEGTTEPLYSWAHPPDPEIAHFGSAIALGEILGGTAPQDLHGSLVYSDYANGRIEYLSFNPDGSVQSSEILTETGKHPVWLGQAPNGFLYYIHFDFVDGKSQIRRLRITDQADSGINVGPIQASASFGAAPLRVSFEAEVTGDLDDDDDLTYHWDFGDGGTSNDVAPVHTYVSEGSFESRLTVTTDDSINFSEPLVVAVGTAPDLEITSAPTAFSAGDTLSFEGAAGIGDVVLTWDLVFDHDTHSHPVVTAHEGSTLQYVVPRTGHDWSGDTSLRVVLTAEDAAGLRSSTELSLQPNRVLVEVTANLPGVQFTQDGQVFDTPRTIETIVGFEHQLAVVHSPGDGFEQWSDGGPASRTLVVPAQDLDLEIQFRSVVANAHSIDDILSAADYTRNGAEVLRLYQAVFGREPDLQGAQYWIGVNQQGLSVDDIAFYFADSKEFKARFGNATTNWEYLVVVYGNTLNREPDRPGAKYWLREMRLGLDRHLVVRWFAGSQEFANNFPYGFDS